MMMLMEGGERPISHSMPKLLLQLLRAAAFMEMSNGIIVPVLAITNEGLLIIVIAAVIKVTLNDEC
jgi:hypothetical protein